MKRLIHYSWRYVDCLDALPLPTSLTLPGWVSVLSQYTYLLTSQLESQRLFFEEKLLRVEKEANDKVFLMHCCFLCT